MSHDTLNLVLLDSRFPVGSALQFWAQDGYTTNLMKARLFTVTGAVGQHECRQSDVPMRFDYLDERKEKMVDCQYLKDDDRINSVEALHAFAENTEFYAIVPGQWDGNAVYFVTEKGRPSTDVRNAKLFTREQAEVLLIGGQHRIWPQAHIQAREYWCVREPQVDRKAALEGTGIQLVKPRPPRKERYRCDSCGRFCSAEAYYVSGCSCGKSCY